MNAGRSSRACRRPGLFRARWRRRSAGIPSSRARSCLAGIFGEWLVWVADPCVVRDSLGWSGLASEVRSLAQRSAQAAMNVKGLVTNSTGQAREGSSWSIAPGPRWPEIVGGDRLRARRQHDDLGPHRGALIEVDHILVDHADAAGGHAL